MCPAKEREWVNRGFINGPLGPTYGCGALAVYLGAVSVSGEPADSVLWRRYRGWLPWSM